MKAPAKTPLRFAADTTFHLLNAAKSARRVEDTALDATAVARARKIKALAFALRQEAKKLEEAL